MKTNNKQVGRRKCPLFKPLHLGVQQQRKKVCKNKPGEPSIARPCSCSPSRLEHTLETQKNTPCEPLAVSSNYSTAGSSDTRRRGTPGTRVFSAVTRVGGGEAWPPPRAASQELREAGRCQDLQVALRQRLGKVDSVRYSCAWP